jgi:dCTP deaminase
VILSDRDLRDRLETDDLITPDTNMSDIVVQPASLDLHLGSQFRRFVQDTFEPLDPRTDEYRTELIEASEEEPYILFPGEATLGATRERLLVPDDLVAFVDGKSSLGRLFLVVHATAGYIDPGFQGTVTLEFVNWGPRPLMLWPGMPICQVRFAKLSSPAEFPYGHDQLSSKYQGQTEPTASRFQENFK